MMDLTVYATASHQVRCAEAVVAGVTSVGGRGRVVHATSELTTLHVACWGWRVGKELKARGHKVLVMERAYLGDRFAWFSLGWGGLNGYASFDTQDDGGARFREHFAHLMQPWKTGGKFVLLIGQVPGDMSLRGRDLKPWYATATQQALIHYGLPVVFRPHPQAIKLGHPTICPKGATLSTGSLAEDLARAAVCITFNSNTGVESVLAGVPTVTADDGSMARAVTGHVIGDMLRPDRDEWASRLAWCQWQLDEITSGKPFWNIHA
jgi:hypothetical protein